MDKSQNCRYYGSMTGCRYGSNCRYSHSNPNSVPFCTFYQTNSCRFGNNCRFRHRNFPQNSLNNIHIARPMINHNNYSGYNTNQLNTPNHQNNNSNQNKIQFLNIPTSNPNTINTSSFMNPFISSTPNTNPNHKNSNAFINPNQMQPNYAHSTPNFIAFAEPSLPQKKIHPSIQNASGMEVYAIDIANDTCDGMCKVNDSFDDLCISLKRIITAHNYYMLLDVQNNNDHKEIFTSFIHDVYDEHILDDFEHLMNDHRYNIYEINQIWTKSQKSTSGCELKKCAATSRHYLREEAIDEDIKEQNVEPTDSILSFYAHLFDAVHFYLVHIFESGVRVTPLKYVKNAHDGDRSTQISKEFKRLMNEVNKRKASMPNFKRFTSQLKFTIGLNDERDTGAYINIHST